MNTTTLNDLMQVDHVIRVDGDGCITDADGMYAPELMMETDDDGQILDSHERAYIDEVKRQGWDLLTGWTGQYSYHGPIMHSSEYVGGHLEDHIRETPGFYAVITVECDDDEAAGWTIAYREA